MIPRSGGDYMLVSRVIDPLVGIISSFCMTMAGLLSNAFFGIAFVTSALGPGCVVDRNDRRITRASIDFGTKISTQPRLGVRPRLRDDRGRLPDPPRRLALDDPVPVDRCSGSVTGGHAARASAPLLFTRQELVREQLQLVRRARTSTRTRSTRAPRPGTQVEPELLVRADDDPRGGARDRLDLLLLVDVRRRRAAPGEHAQDGEQHGARPASVGLIVVAIFGCDHPPLGRARVHDRARTAAGSRRASRSRRRSCSCRRRASATRFRDRHRDLLLRVLAAHHAGCRCSSRRACCSPTRSTECSRSCSRARRAAARRGSRCSSPAPPRSLCSGGRPGRARSSRRSPTRR